MINDPKRQYDGFVSVEGGMDSGKSPSILKPNQVAWAVNATMRGGFLSCRPGIKKISIDFPDEDTQAAFQDGFFQGAGTYVTLSGDSFLVASISGRIFAINLSRGNELSEITPSTGENSPNQLKAWFQQAEYWLVIQDNQSKPILWDGSAARRATYDEVPVGGPMAYGKGRLWVANGRDYVGGDLAYTDDALGAGSVIKFTENTFIAEGGAFTVPSTGGSVINAISFAANLDTSLGDGDMLIFTDRDVFAFDAPLDRTTWKDLDYPIQRYALIDYGTYSATSVVRVNGDVFFRSRDGIRSIAYARRDFQARWGNTPVSSEVDRAMRYDNEKWLSAASATNFDNRLLMTVGPHFSVKGVYHDGMTVLDFDLISGMGEKLPPAWDGVWTGIKVQQLLKVVVNGTERCFAFALDTSGGASSAVRYLWEITKSNTFDYNGTQNVPIQWAVETRSMPFKTHFEEKRIAGADLWLSEMMGDVSVTAKYKADLNPIWSEWATATDCATVANCADGVSCHVPLQARAQTRNRITLPTPPDSTDPVNGTMARFGGEFQIRLENIGRFKLRKLRAWAEVDTENLYGMSKTTTCETALVEECQTGCPTISGCDPKDYAYDILNPPDPPTTSTTVYYGRSGLTFISGDEIPNLLTAIDTGSNAGTYLFPSGSGYLYFAFPSVPTSATLTINGFTVSFASTAQGYDQGSEPLKYMTQIVGGETYYLFRTYYKLGGATSIDIT